MYVWVSVYVLPESSNHFEVCIPGKCADPVATLSLPGGFSGFLVALNLGPENLQRPLCVLKSSGNASGFVSRMSGEID